MIDYKNVSDDILEKELEKVKNKIYIYQDNSKDTTELMQYLDQLNKESLRRMFKEMPPEELFTKLETMEDSEVMEKIHKEFNEKYMTELPDMPLPRLNSLIERLKKIRDLYTESLDWNLFDDGINLSLEITQTILDYYNLLQDKYPERFAGIKEKLFREAIFISYTDALDQTIEKAIQAYQLLSKNPYTQETYDAVYLYTHYPSWMNWYDEEKTKEQKEKSR